MSRSQVMLDKWVSIFTKATPPTVDHTGIEVMWIRSCMGEAFDHPLSLLTTRNRGGGSPTMRWRTNQNQTLLSEPTRRVYA